MTTILVDRHSGTEIPNSSLHTFFSMLEATLAERYNILRVPPRHQQPEATIREWVLRHGLGADLLVGNSSTVIRVLRQHGWQGKILYVALGDLPRGGVGLRDALPYLHPTDVIWCSCGADRQIYERLVVQDGTQPSPILLPFGVDSEVYRPLEPAVKQQLRSAWGLSPAMIVAVYAGRVTLEKNVHSILEAMGRLCAEGVPLKLLVAGKVQNVTFKEFNLSTYDLDSKIQHLLHRLNLKEHVQFLPWLDSVHLNELYNLGDLFINLTLHHDENFGFAQVEAMSAGLPVIGTAWGGLKDTVVDGETGFLADTWLSAYGVRFDMPAVLRSLRQCVQRPALRQALSAGARHRAHAEYGWPVFRDRLHTLIAALLSRPTRRQRPQFTPFGAAFHARFCSNHEGTSIARRPVYESLADNDYLHVIEPYTSRGLRNIEPLSELFVALTGRIEREFFISTDLLRPIRVPINEAEEQVLHQINRYQPTRRCQLDAPTAIISGLIEKGLLGVSRPSR